MKLFKLFTAAAVALSLSLATVPVFAQNTETNSTENSGKFFEKMIALDLLEDTDVTDTEQMLRGDFVRMAMKIANVQVEGLTDGHDYFNDLESTAINRQYINAACELGYVSGEGGSFYPNNAISKPQALKILMEILGYNTLAEYHGGYPGGYMVCADESGMLDDLKIENDDALTLSDGLKLLNAFLDAKLPLRSFDGDRMSVDVSDETLAEHLNIGEAKGILSESGATGLYSKNPRSRYEVCIGGVYMLIKEGVICDDYLGLNCTAYYRINKTTDEKVLCWFEETPGKNNVIEMDCSDIDYKNGGYVYRVNSKEKNAKLSSTYTLIYNGQFAAPTDSLMDTDNGFIKLIDNDNDDKYDVVFVYQFETYVLDDLNLSENRLVAKSGDVFDVETDKDKYVNVYLDGKREDISIFAAPMVFSYAESANYGRSVKTFYVSSTTVNGKAVSKSQKEVKIDDTVYKLRSPLYSEIPLNTECKFFIDSFGYVAYFEINKDKANIGFLTECKIVQTYDGKDRGFIRLFGDDAKFKDYIFAEKVRYNGAAKDYGKKIVDEWLRDGSYQQLISFKLNEDGEVCQVDTAADAPIFTDEGEKARANNVFRKSSAGSTTFRVTNYTFNLYVNVDANTKVFFIPTNLSVEEDYRVVNRYMLSNGGTYNYTAYNADEFGTAEIVVCRLDYKSDSHGFHIVEGVGTALDNDGDNRKMIECYSGSTLTQFVLADSCTFNPDTLKPGDIIQIWKNNAGEVALVKQLYSYSEGVYPEFATSVRYSDNLVAGTVKKTDRGGGKLVVEVEGEYMIFNLPASNAVVYDNGICTTIPTSEICAGDHVVLKTSEANISNATVIR